MTTRFVGDSALLVDTENAQAAQQLCAVIHRQSLKGLRELVPAYNTLLVEFDPLEFDVMQFIRRLPQFLKASPLRGRVREHDIEVTYNGEDLKEVARVTGLSIIEVILCHSAATYTVAFLGFAPGFPYLAGLDPKLRMPRLQSPRTQVPAGAVAIADEFSGIYPQATPGGWRILGHTNTVLFDVSRPTPALLMPSDTVHFQPLA